MREENIHLTNPAADALPAAGSRRLRLLFPILIIVGVILIAVSVILLLRGAGAGSAPDASLLV